MISEELLLSAVRESVKKVMESLEAPADSDQSEKLKQDSISSKIDDLGARKRENEKFEVDEEKEEDPEIDLTGDEKEKEEEKFSYDVPDTFPKHVKFQDIVDQLNYVRSGASAKDDEVKKGLMKYFDNLKDEEKRDLLAMLSGFATIMNKAGDIEDAPTPSELEDATKKSEKSEEEPSKVPVNKPGMKPIVVGEAAEKHVEYSILVENNSDSHRCTNGQIVGFGSEECLNDLIRRIDDAKESRDSCSRGSESRSHYNGLLKHLRMQLRAAQKLSK